MPRALLERVVRTKRSIGFARDLSTGSTSPRGPAPNSTSGRWGETQPSERRLPAVAGADSPRPPLPVPEALGLRGCTAPCCAAAQPPAPCPAPSCPRRHQHRTQLRAPTSAPCGQRQRLAGPPRSPFLRTLENSFSAVPFLFFTPLPISLFAVNY